MKQQKMFYSLLHKRNIYGGPPSAPGTVPGAWYTSMNRQKKTLTLWSLHSSEDF